MKPLGLFKHQDAALGVDSRVEYVNRPARLHGSAREVSVGALVAVVTGLVSCSA
jgi:hypothetical protein